MTSLDDKLENLAVETPKETGGVGMVLWQTTLGLAILFVWQGVSGRLVDNFFISNPIDVGRRLLGWTLDGSIFVHLWATVYATSVGFALGQHAREIVRLPCATRGDHRDVRGARHRASQLAIESALHAVGVHRRQQDLARATHFAFGGPRHGVHSFVVPAAARENVPASGGAASRVNC